MVSFKRLCLFGTVALAAIVQVRDLKTLLSYFQKIDNDVNQLVRDDKTSGSLIGLSHDLGVIDRDIQSASAYVEHEPGYNSADSKILVGALKGTFASDIKTALSIVVNHKIDYSRAGLTGLAKSDLMTLKSRTDTFLVALNNILSGDQRGQGLSAVNTIDGYFVSAIGPFS